MKKILLLFITTTIATLLYGMESDTADIQNQITPTYRPPSYTAQIIPPANIINSASTIEQTQQSASTTQNYSLKALMGMNCFGCFGHKQVSPSTAPHNAAIAHNTEDITIVLPKDHSSSLQQYEKLNANDIETLTQSTFAELITERHLQSQDYTLARIMTTKIVQENGSASQKTFIHYLDAQESQKVQDNQNPINRIPIQKTDCYNIKPNNPRKAIHAFTVFGALSRINAQTSAEHSGAPINQPHGSHAETRLGGTFSCDQYTCNKCIKITCVCLECCLECGKQITYGCCKGGIWLIGGCLPATVCAIAAPAIDCAFLPCAPIVYYCCGDTDCKFACGLSRTFCPKYCAFITCES